MMSSSASAQTCTSLDTVLEKLDLHSRDLLVGVLQSGRCLKHARLTCRALRDTVDGSLGKINVLVKAADAERVAAGVKFPLWRWTRLTRIAISPDYGEPGFTEMALPFIGQPAECLLRITDVKFVSHDLSTTVEATAALASLLYRMSSVRSVHLRVPLSSEPLQQLVLSDALGSLTQLEELDLGRGFPAALVGRLADRLKRVTLYPSETVTVGDLCCAVSMMHLLESAELAELQADRASPLVDLLKRPPPKLQTLRVVMLEEVRWLMHLTSGRVTSVRQEVEYPEFQDILDFAAEVLLPLLDVSLLDSLELDGLFLPLLKDYDRRLQPLRALVKRCRRVRLGTLTLANGVQVSHGLDTVRLLGMPDHIDFFCDYVGCRVDLRRNSSPGAASSLHEGPAASGTSSSGGGGGLPAARGVNLALELMLQRLDQQQQLPADSRRGSVVQLVRLRSPLFTRLACAPDALRAWMLQLASHAAEEQVAAAAAAGADAAAQAGASASAPMKACCPVPTAGAVVVECASAEGAAAVAAAARKALAAVGFCHGHDDDAVRVHVVAASSPDELLVEACQALWDSGQGGSEEERLQLLLEVGCGLAVKWPWMGLQEADELAAAAAAAAAAAPWAQ
ncbi:hypothetical protein PLESTB_000731700 [Pleodorina starrii]|uniref:Uncharacterized protein n=1 Tax=Pleodorina starrii TaxID=330485 RepID=A0A9W6BJK6_9CHLO|nr:hypothetical protein PLESTM_000192200 [Pleodorina starrii]GLC53319.1 hypothetical protein PLESTB_000731700 [Pleodorina starrii]GLC67212.1 hypothetical protein PLESTF_000529600 [Pleodorina starrii]